MTNCSIDSAGSTEHQVHTFSVGTPVAREAANVTGTLADVRMRTFKAVVIALSLYGPGGQDREDLVPCR